MKTVEGLGLEDGLGFRAYGLHGLDAHRLGFRSLGFRMKGKSYRKGFGGILSGGFRPKDSCVRT